MGIFEKAGRNLDQNVDQAKRTGRHLVRNARGVEFDTHAEIRSLLDQLEASLREGRDSDVAALRERLGSQLAQARSLFDDAQDTVRARFVSAVSATEQQIQRRPWETLGAVASIAFLLGILATRA